MDHAKHPHLEDAIRHCGGQTKLAERIGKSQQLVSYWRRSKNGVPPQYAKAVEDATGGVITKEDLCPDVFGPSTEGRAA